jgi:hypothetical protein
MTRAVRRFFRRNVQEIAADPVLRIYGAVLAVVHVLTFLHWQPGLGRILAPEAMPICWPFFEECHRFRVLGAGAVRAFLWGYLATAVAALALSWRTRTVTPAYALLVALEAVKVLVIVQDYRLRLNQHYMAFFVAATFLFLPGKRRALPYLLIAFYFWAGTVKLNREWLSGAALYRREALWLPDALVPAACAYVVALELVLVFGLLARRRWVFWGTLGQVTLFHLMSWPIVGFFYPTLMLALVAIFPLARHLAPAREPPTVGSLLAGREAPPTYATLAGFSLLQLVPYAFPGDPAITGEGRLFALHMFDARVVCEASLTLHDGRGGTQRVRVQTDRGSIRTRCDPIVHFNVARAFCREGAASGRWRDLDLSLRSRRSTEPALRPVVEIERFCAANPTYDLWRPNPWIRKD